LGELGFRRSNLDRPVAVNTQIAKVGDDVAGFFVGDIAEDDVALRPEFHAAQDDDVGYRLQLAKQFEHLARERSRRDDAQLDHGLSTRVLSGRTIFLSKRIIK